MNKNLILKTDILDIIFENRNKAYGAYSLRKLYPHRLKLALGFMFLFAVAFSAFTFLPGKNKSVRTEVYIIDEHVFAEAEKPKEEIKKPEIKKPEVPKADAIPAASNQKLFVSTIKVVDDTQKTDSIATLLPTDVISTVTINIPSAPPAVVVPVAPPAPVGGGSGNTKIDVNTPLDKDAVDVMPAFPGGMAALQKFLEKNLENPYDAENGQTVSVKVKFVVGYNGKLQRFETVQDGGEVYNKEVVRVLKKMPDWEPGKARGENVSVYYTIPVKFVMSN